MKRLLALLAVAALLPFAAAIPQTTGVPVTGPVATYSGATTANDIPIFSNATGRLASSGYQLLNSFNADSYLGNASASPAATVGQIALPACNSNNGQWLQYISGTGFSCSSGNWRLVKNASTVGSFTAGTTGSEQRIVQVKVADTGTMGTDGCVRVSSLWSFTNSANNKTLIMRFGTLSNLTGGGGTAIFSTTVTNQQNGWDRKTICNNGSASAQRVAKNGWGVELGGASTAYGTNTINTAANDLYVGYSVNIATSTETTSIDRVIVEFLPGVP